MSVLHLIRDGASAAAQLVALLFIVPPATANATEAPTAVQSTADAVAPARVAAPEPASPTVHELHVVAATLDVRLLGLLADVRVVQTVRNVSRQAIELAAQLPAGSEAGERRSITRDGHTVELLADPFGSCGSDDDDPHAGHAGMELDETLAHLLHLLPGQQATIEVGVSGTLERHGGAYRIALPAAVAPLEAQALLLNQRAGTTLVIVPPPGVDGTATLTLRPATGPARDITLGHAVAGNAFIIPLADADAVAPFTQGAVEFEIRADRHVLWMTLPSTRRDAGAATLARAAN
jgi:hypothetical protein